MVNPPSVGIAGGDGSWTVIVDGPYVVQAQWGMNYLPLIMIFVMVATVGTVGVGTAVGYKRGAFSRGHPQKVPATPVVRANVCGKCGSVLPQGAAFCEKCNPGGAVAQMLPEDKVYDYIVKHQGTISFSVASADLGIPAERLKEITERLKREGRLS
jgi:hypothetical protein